MGRFYLIKKALKLLLKPIQLVLPGFVGKQPLLANPIHVQIALSLILDVVLHFQRVFRLWPHPQDLIEVRLEDADVLLVLLRALFVLLRQFFVKFDQIVLISFLILACSMKSFGC